MNKISEKAVWESVDIEDSKGTTPSLHVQFCYKCGMEIPPDSEFCPSCGIRPYLDCPKCNSKFLSKYAYCPKCGTNREMYIAEQKRIQEIRLEEQRKQIILEQWRQEEEQRKKEEAEIKKRANENLIKSLEDLLNKKECLLNKLTKYRTLICGVTILLLISSTLFLLSTFDNILSLIYTVPVSDEAYYKITKIAYNDNIPSYKPEFKKYEKLVLGKTFKLKRISDRLQLVGIDTSIKANKYHTRVEKLFKNDNSFAQIEISFNATSSIPGRRFRRFGVASFAINGSHLFDIYIKYLPNNQNLSLNLTEIVDHKFADKSISNGMYKIEYCQCSDWIYINNIQLIDPSLPNICSISYWGLSMFHKGPNYARENIIITHYDEEYFDEQYRIALYPTPDHGRYRMEVYFNGYNYE